MLPSPAWAPCTHASAREIERPCWPVLTRTCPLVARQSTAFQSSSSGTTSGSATTYDSTATSYSVVIKNRITVDIDCSRIRCMGVTWVCPLG